MLSLREIGTIDGLANRLAAAMARQIKIGTAISGSRISDAAMARTMSIVFDSRFD